VECERRDFGDLRRATRDLCLGADGIGGHRSRLDLHDSCGDGAGVPSDTAIADCSRASGEGPKRAADSDGGLKFSGDISIGPSQRVGCPLMLGGLLAGTEEVRAKRFSIGPHLQSYTVEWALGLNSAGSTDRLFSDGPAESGVPAGHRGRVPYQGSLGLIGLSPGRGAAGGNGLLRLPDDSGIAGRASFLRVTSAVYAKSRGGGWGGGGASHDVIITKTPQLPPEL